MTGFNFRFTEAYVTDAVGDFWIGETVFYGANGGPYDFGWATGLVSSNDRNAGIDVRLAGGGKTSNDGVQELFVANTGNGNFDVNIAVGDASFSGTHYCEILDVDTSNVVQSVLAVVISGGVNGGGQWFDATGAIRTSSTDWVTNNLAKNVTVVSGRLGIRIGSAGVQTGTSAISHAAIESVATGPTLTGPDTTTVDAVRVAAGTALDTATTAGLKTVGYSKSLTIDSQTTTTLNQTDSIDAGIALGTPVASLPVEADVLAAGATAWQIQQWVDDGVNPEVARNITLNYLPAHTTVQAMVATSNTTVGESFLATDIIAVEDEMQATGPNVVDTVTITYNADGTMTTDKDQTIAFNMRYWSPSTGQASLATITVLKSKSGRGAIFAPNYAPNFGTRIYRAG